MWPSLGGYTVAIISAHDPGQQGGLVWAPCFWPDNECSKTTNSYGDVKI